MSHLPCKLLTCQRAAIILRLSSNKSLKDRSAFMQRAGFNSYAQLPVTTTVDYFIDSGSGEWLIPK